MVDFKLTLDQSLKLALSMEMKLSIDILKMSLKELRDYLRDESIKNPNIEIIYSKPLILKNDDYENYIENISEKDESLIDYLEEQVTYLDLEKKTKEILGYLINNLDEKGYLIGNLEELRKDGNFKLIPFKKALSILKTLEPLGVGAENLIDCLKIQLNHKDILTPTLELILEKNLEDIAKNDLKKIALERDITMEKVANYVEIIKQLNPKPARGFYVNKKTRYIIPDLIAEILENNIIVSLNEEDIPKIKLKNDEGSKNEFALLLAIERGIKKRQETLLKVGNYVLNYQKEYIIFNKPLKTLKVKDIAYELTLHESTISRALKDKYIKINGKVENLRNYIILDDKANIIKDEIIEIIKNENKNSPLSDEKILEKLLLKNFNLQRRTVGKYREELGIPSSRKRKK
ncbi:RNA polymerase factor sigma-54 [Cetobacterium somerae]|uniref:RNA polymerase factor sigma-54 n=1 Tax=Cetobacterium sp. NK01 TaxID=2993530 RepID=UPI0021170C94|nr:RNA polymerase factor sigma-54 [Cetobacterium sp. NK01]MCQ8211964.1 RNA polymerase factor sigma-54 [Cetobacterium sp. NK01]